MDTAIGDYYVSDDAFAENRRPIEPTTRLDVTQPNLVAHGALITGLVSVDEPNFDAAFSRVVEDLSAFSPELVGDTTFPTKLQSIATIATPTGTRQRLGLFAGQFRSDGIPEALGIGTQRRFTSLSGNVFYAAPSVTDFTPPTFSPVDVTQAASTVAFAVDIEDNAAAGVKRVVALYRDESNSWKSIEMSQGSRWSGAGPLVGTTVEWFIQAVDASGNVAVTSNKSVGKSVTPEEPTGDIHAEVTSGTLHQPSGWYTTDVGVTISGAPGIRYSLDGAPFTPPASPPVSVPVLGTGVHSLDFQGSDSSHGSLTVSIDKSNPTVNGQRRPTASGRWPTRSAPTPAPVSPPAPSRIRSTRASVGTKTINVQAAGSSRAPVLGDPHLQGGCRLALHVHGLLLAGRQPSDDQRRQRRQQHSCQVQPRRQLGPQRVRPWLPGVAADDLPGRRHRPNRGDVAAR